MSTPGSRTMVSGPQTREHGFTLIEVMVSALLLLIILAGFVPVFLSGLGSATRERYRSLATNLAQERIEQIRQLDYREIGTASDLQARFAANSGNDPVVRGATFHITYDPAPTPYPSGASQPLMKVSVKVTWVAPPAESPIVVSTMIDQMYVGPRGSLLEITPSQPDPLGTPFRKVAGAVQVKYHVAQADWGLVLTDVTNPAAGVQNVYMRLAFADKNGVMTTTGDPANDSKIDKSHVYYTVGGTGAVTDVYFLWDISKIDDYDGVNIGGPGLLRDGYWETQATIYNAYDQPGNLWRLTVRVGNGPGAPHLVATPGQAVPGGPWNQVLLTWTPGAETDRAYFVLTRTLDSNLPVTLDNTIGPLGTTYTDTGDVSTTPKKDPWGDGTKTNSYTYAIHAVDTANFAGADGTASVQMPPPSTTTSTTLAAWVKLVNNSNQDWAVMITKSPNTLFWSGTVTKNNFKQVTGLGQGEYSVVASRQGNQTISSSFSIPPQPMQPVLTISQGSP